jgi:hypothetical protein
MITEGLEIKVRFDFSPLIDGLKRTAAAFEEVGRVFREMRRPSNAYKWAGAPYGRNRRGKKRWLLERKRAARVNSLT